MARWWLLAISLAWGCGDDGGGADSSAAVDPVRWFAPSSVAPVADELVARFREASGTDVRVNLAATSVLARQIVNGAPADVWISADREWVEYVAERVPLRSVAWATNRVVVVCGADAGDGFPRAWMPDDRFAIGDPDHVPVGRYAKAWLEANGWWEDLEPHLVYAPHARAVLAYVEAGAAACGAVYATDARGSNRVRVMEDAGASSATEYRLVTFPSPRAPVAAFAAFLLADVADSILAAAGFGLPSEREP